MSLNGQIITTTATAAAATTTNFIAIGPVISQVEGRT
jgi:hypothetical protein